MLRDESVINLDNNATTPLTRAVVERMTELMHMGLANPSSQHAAGRKARSIVEQARETILASCGARMHGMSSDQLIFTSGGTESNNLAIFGMADKSPGTVVLSKIEHPSISECATALQKRGRKVVYLPCDSSGVVSMDALNATLVESSESENVGIVSIMLANNETGVIQPVAEAARLCHHHGVPIHTDASQAFGKLPVNFHNLGVDAMTITAHKLHGPIGIGALVMQPEFAKSLAAQLFGGFQQQGLRPGTESALLAGGFATASNSAFQSLESRIQTMQILRDSLQQRLCDRISDTFLIAEKSPRLPNTLSIAFAGADRQALQLALDIAGVACSTGSACASGSSQPSPVLQSMGLPQQVLQGAIRFAVSFETTSQEIERAAVIVSDVVARLRSKSLVSAS